MEKKFLSVVFGFIVAVIILSAFEFLFAQNIFEKPESLKVEAVSERMIYSLGQEVNITVYLKNISEDTLELVEPAIDKRSLNFDITLPNTKKEKLLDIYGLTLETVRLAPKKRLKFTAKFTPESSGNYFIDVRYNGFQNKTLSAITVSVFVVSSQTVSGNKIKDKP